MQSKKALSRDTFCALLQTVRGLRELANYLLDVYNLPHVLLGKINSDLIDREFVVLRQLAGADFYLSMRQFIEGEKKIRLRNLTRFEGMTLAEIKEMGKEQEEMSKEVVQTDADLLNANLKDLNADELHDK